MPSVDWGSITDVSVYRAEMVSAQQNLNVAMQNAGESFTYKLEEAKEASREASVALDKPELALETSGWQSAAGMQAQKLVNSLKAKNAQHYSQRLDQYVAIDSAVAQITQVWNS